MGTKTSLEVGVADPCPYKHCTGENHQTHLPGFRPQTTRKAGCQDGQRPACTVEAAYIGLVFLCKDYIRSEAG
jgi:hypothetical protein